MKSRTIFLVTLIFVLPLLLAVLTGCANLTQVETEKLLTQPPPMVPTVIRSPSTPSITPSPSAVPLTNSVIASCPVTVANESTPPNTNWRPSNHHGNGTLWVGFWPENKVLVEPDQVNADGSIGVKFGWYRGVRGQLVVEGRRLDAPAPPAQGFYSGEGYGDIGFQAGGILFPSEGCWEITGKVGTASLTFVTLVIRIPFKILWPAWSPEGMILIPESWDVTDLPRSIRNVYGSPDGGEVIFETTRGLQENTVPYPNTFTQQVTVNGQPGVCVKGAWDKQGQWRANADAGALEWSANGLSYRISHSGLKLRCEDLLRMAGSSP